MWQRFSQHARKAVFYAQEEAQKFGHSHVGNVHLLLGVLREPENMACIALMRLGVSLTEIREAVLKDVQKDQAHFSHDMTLTPEAKGVINRAYAEARELGNDYIGTEHLLFGLLHKPESVSVTVIRQFGVEYDALRSVVKELQENTGIKPVDVGAQPSEQLFFIGGGAELTREAEKTIARAQEEVVRSGYPYMSTEHLLLAVVQEPASIASLSLERLGVTIAQVEGEVRRHMPSISEVSNRTTGIMFTPRLRRAIDFAYDEARRHNHGLVGPEYLLLGLCREGGGVAGRVLAKFGVKQDVLRDAVDTIRKEKQVDDHLLPLIDQTTHNHTGQTFVLGKEVRELVLYGYCEAQRQGRGEVTLEHLVIGLLIRSTISTDSIYVDLQNKLDTSNADVESAPQVVLSEAVFQVFSKASGSADSVGVQGLLKAILLDANSEAARALEILGLSLQSLGE